MQKRSNCDFLNFIGGVGGGGSLVTISKRTIDYKERVICVDDAKRAHIFSKNMFLATERDNTEKR